MKNNHPKLGKLFERNFERNLKFLAIAVQEETQNWWLKDVAKATGLHSQTISKFLHGKTKSPHYLTVMRLAKAFDIKF